MIFFKTREEAEEVRQPNERIYFSPYQGYYIVKQKGKNVWERLFG